MQQVMIEIFIRNHHPQDECLGNCLQQALRKIGKENIVNNCVFNIEWVTDAAEKEVAKARLISRGASVEGTGVSGRRVCLFLYTFEN